MELFRRSGRREGPAWLVAGMILVLAALSAYYLVRDEVEASAPPDPGPDARAAVPDWAVSRHGGLLHDPSYQARVDSVLARLVERSLVDDTELDAEVHVLADGDTATAFVAPGHILVTRALVDELAGGERLAGVLAHQVGHLLAGAEEGIGPEGAGAETRDRWDVEDETHADRLALRILGEAGYDRGALLRGLDALEAAGSAFIERHPYPSRRRDELLAMMEQMGREMQSDVVR